MRTILRFGFDFSQMFQAPETSAALPFRKFCFGCKAFNSRPAFAGVVRMVCKCE